MLTLGLAPTDTQRETLVIKHNTTNKTCSNLLGASGEKEQ